MKIQFNHIIYKQLLANLVIIICILYSNYTYCQVGTDVLPPPDFKKLEQNASPQVKAEIEKTKASPEFKKHPYEIGVTSMSGKYPDQEWKIDPKIDKNYKIRQNNIATNTLSEFKFKKVASASTPPGSLTQLVCNLSYYVVPNLSPVREQNETGSGKYQKCGSCWAHAILGATETSYANRRDMSLNLSEQQLVDCTTPLTDGCAGYNVEVPLAYMMFPGVITEKSYPYEAIDHGSCTDRDLPVPLLQAKQHYRIMEWGYAGNNPTSSQNSIDEIKSAILAHGAVISGVDVVGMNDYKGGIFYGIPTSYPFKYPHVLNIVGWDDCKGCWLLRNSHGRDWGSEGYMWIRYGANGIGTHTIWVEAAPAPSQNDPVEEALKDIAWNITNYTGNVAGTVLSDGKYKIYCYGYSDFGKKYLTHKWSCLHDDQNGCQLILNYLGDPGNNIFDVQHDDRLGGYFVKMGDKVMEVDSDAQNANVEMGEKVSVGIDALGEEHWYFYKVNNNLGLKLYAIKLSGTGGISSRFLDADNGCRSGECDVNIRGISKDDQTQLWVLEKVN